jgi:hypothetical protein
VKFIEAKICSLIDIHANKKPSQSRLERHKFLIV